MNSQQGEFFKTTAGVCQGCLLSLILFNLFLEKIMQETPHDHHASIPIDGRPIYNLRFADDIDLMGSSNSELQDLINRLEDKATPRLMIIYQHTKFGYKRQQFRRYYPDKIQTHRCCDSNITPLTNFVTHTDTDTHTHILILKNQHNYQTLSLGPNVSCGLCQKQTTRFHHPKSSQGHC